MKPTEPVTNDQLAALQRTLNKLFSGYYVLIFSRSQGSTEMLSQEMPYPDLAKILHTISDLVSKKMMTEEVLNDRTRLPQQP